MYISQRKGRSYHVKIHFLMKSGRSFKHSANSSGCLQSARLSAEDIAVNKTIKMSFLMEFIFQCGRQTDILKNKILSMSDGSSAIEKEIGGRAYLQQECESSWATYSYSN